MLDTHLDKSQRVSQSNILSLNFKMLGIDFTGNQSRLDLMIIVFIYASIELDECLLILNIVISLEQMKN